MGIKQGWALVGNIDVRPYMSQTLLFPKEFNLNKLGQYGKATWPL